MNLSKIGVRYAKALLELASDKNKLDVVYQDLKNVEQVMDDKSISLYEVLNNPILKPSFKAHLIEEIFKTNVDELTLKFLLLVIKKGRESFFDAIFRNFYKQYNELNKIREINIITAIEPDNKIVEKIKALAHKIVPEDYKIKINTEQDKEIIGGFVLEVEDYEFDATVKNKLQTIKNELLNTSYKIKL